MTMSTYRRQFAFNWIVTLFAVLIVLVGFAGMNTITGDYDFARGITTVASAFGGLMSFLALVGVLVLLAAIVVGLVYMTGHDYTDESRLQIIHITIGVLVVIGAALIGLKWIHLPSGSGLISLGFFVIITVATALMTPRVLKDTTAS